MKTIKNAIQSIMLEIREEHDPSTIFCLWLVFAVILGIMIGLTFLTIRAPIAGLCVFSTIFLPIAFILYSKFSDDAIDERIKKLNDEREKWSRSRY